MQQEPIETRTVGAIEPGVLTMIRDEREKALSTREWQFRLRGYGYGIKTIEGDLVTALVALAKLLRIPVQAPQRLIHMP